jgi:eukaryotic-like serine/threonine-protein kinase
MNNAGLTHAPSSAHASAVSLRESLVRLNICRERDFRRCRRRVRRLARGIPAFDFVWIDALLSAGVLTPFQARLLETTPPDALRLGPCVLLERLGSGEFCETYVAVTPGGLDKVSLKRVRPTPDVTSQVFERLQRLIERAQGLESPFVATPHFAERHSGDLIVLSRYVDGPSCRELLIRRGRFPIEVVAQMARQLARGLAALESRGVLHGQIQLANVRVNAAGHAVLVDAGISETLERGLLLRSDVPPEMYEGTAPELIGTGNAKTTASELYAFGCLLWELLAGRPPFPTGDPLAKLAAHRSRSVPDIREFAPDTPQPLADAIRALTNHDSLKRPSSFNEVAIRFGEANQAGERRLMQFRRQFDTAAPLMRPVKERPSRPPMAAVCVVLLLFAGAGLVLSDSSIWSGLKSFRWTKSAQASRVTEQPVAINRTSVDRASHDVARSVPTLRPLPKPNSDGFVLLDAGPYDARSFSFVGDLSIRGVKSQPAVIVVGERPLEAVCRRFSLTNIALRRDGSDDDALLSVRSQDVAIDRCSFSAARSSQAVVWSAVLARDPDAGRMRLSNSMFFNLGAAVLCKSPPGRLEAENCLKLGGSFFELANWPTSRELQVVARHVTLRRAESLCRVTFSRAGNRKPTARVGLEECAFDLIGSRAALLQVANPGKLGGAAASLVVVGNGSVIRPNIPIAASINDRSSAAVAMDSSSALVEGLSAGDFQFVGEALTASRDSMVDGRSLQIPRQSDATPGIVADRLPFAQTPPTALKWADDSHGQEPLAN